MAALIPVESYVFLASSIIFLTWKTEPAKSGTRAAAYKQGDGVPLSRSINKHLSASSIGPIEALQFTSVSKGYSKWQALLRTCTSITAITQYLPALGDLETDSV